MPGTRRAGRVPPAACVPVPDALTPAGSSPGGASAGSASSRPF